MEDCGFYYFQKGLLTAYNKSNEIQTQLLKTTDKEKFKIWLSEVSAFEDMYYLWVFYYKGEKKK